MRTLLTSLLYILGCLTVSADIYHNPGIIVVNDGESIQDALRQAREWRRTNDSRCTYGIKIVLKAGRYYMNEPLFLRPEDSGWEHSALEICGEEGAVICGDPRQQHTQVWPKEGMERMIDFSTTNRTITIPTPPKQVLKMQHLEMVVHQRWAIAILRVKEMKVEGERTIVSFMEPESRLEFEHPWPQPVIGGERGNSSFLLRTTEQRDGVEQLVVVDGANNVTFEGITFEHTCWNRPLHRGHVTLQGGFPLIDAYKLKEKEGLPWDSGLENQAWVERPVSAVTVKNAEKVYVRKCRFQHLGATALDFEDNTKECMVINCQFEDIGGTAIMAGSFAESPREVHRPYTDLAGRCRGLEIRNNEIHDATNEDWGAVAIGCGYVSHATISHNTVSHVNYSGICVGWGWTPYYTGMEHNRIFGNRISDYARQLYDAGGIYTLSSQPGSEICDNQISQPYPAPYATNNRGFCIYLDARTDGFTIENNRTTAAADTRLIRRDEIGDNHPGPNIIFKQ
ncbi:MAG: right-handed parallel beta-helix repeat-containing protein [Prevotella sp.]|nr:right-handed parallel beta-helix repeat-containing protein [Prevotella sp.]